MAKSSRSSSAFVAMFVLVLGVAASGLTAAAFAAQTSIGPLARWIVSQPVNRCYPWFVSMIGYASGPPYAVLDEHAVNPAQRPDELPGAAGLFKHATREERGGAGTGDASRLAVVYDPVHRIAMYHHEYSEGAADFVQADVSRPPLNVAAADLSEVSSAWRVHLGSPSEHVWKVFGTPRKILRACDTFAYAYDASQRHDCPIRREFVFKANKVVAMMYGEGC